LPAIFPDGMPIDQKAYPWLMTGLVREYMVRLPDRPALYGMQSILGRVIAYGMVPLTLLTLLAVERQELIYSGSVSSGHKYRMLLEIVLFGWAVGSGLYFLSLADYTLQGKKLKPWRVALIGKDGARTNDKNDPRTIGWASGFILSLIVSIAFPFEWYIMLFFICSIVVIFWISLALDRRFDSGLRQQEDQHEVSEP
jgi:hypothetical protein